MRALLYAALAGALLPPSVSYTRLGQIVKEIENLKRSEAPFAERFAAAETIVRHFIDHVHAVDRMVNDHSVALENELDTAITGLDKTATDLDSQFTKLQRALQGRLDHTERVLARNVAMQYKDASAEMWQGQPALRQKAHGFRTPFFALLGLVLLFPVLLFFYHRHLLAQDKKFREDEQSYMQRTNSGQFL